MVTYVTDGLPGGGRTPHYAFSYDSTLKQGAGNPSGPSRPGTAAMIAAAEADYAQLAGWFGNIVLDCDVPIPVNVTPNGGSAAWGKSGRTVTITLNPGAGDAVLCRYLVISEMDEQFMRAQNLGWFGTGTEGSQGEGLSRFLAAEFLALNGLGFTPGGYGISDLWLASDRSDFVNTRNPGDSNPTAASGCALLFIYYLYRQLGFGIRDILAAGADTLGKVYRNLTFDALDPFPDFKQVLDTAFPKATFITIGGTNPDNPFPLPSPRRLASSRHTSFPNPDAFTVGRCCRSPASPRCARPLTATGDRRCPDGQAEMCYSTTSAEFTSARFTLAPRAPPCGLPDGARQLGPLVDHDLGLCGQGGAVPPR